MTRQIIAIGPDDLIDLIRRNTEGQFQISYSSKEPKLHWEQMYNCKWIGSDLACLNGKDLELVLANKMPAIRTRLFEEAKQYGLKVKGIIDKDSIVFESSSIDSSSIIYPGATVSSFSAIGRIAVISYGALVGHGVQVKDASFIAPSARLLGDVEIGARCFVGAGSTILPGMRVGEGSWIGPNIVISKNIDRNTRVIEIGGKLRYLENCSYC